ncbi:hypothetical protein COOONC_08114 [Cooperia oncophora]
MFRLGCIMKKVCVLCGRTAEVSHMKYMSTAKKMNLIMVGCLSLVGIVDRKSVNGVVETVSQKNRFLCHTHVVKAAQYLSAQMVVCGRRFSYYHDPSAGKWVPYLTTGDIPQHQVEIINGMSDGNVTINAWDVMSFVNDALKKYHGSAWWPDHYEEEEAGCEEEYSNGDAEESDSHSEPSASVSEPGVKVELEDEGDVDSYDKREEKFDVSQSHHSTTHSCEATNVNTKLEV